MFIEQFAYQLGCSERIYRIIHDEYSNYLDLIKPQMHVCQCGYGLHPEHNRYNHQVLAGLIALTLLDDPHKSDVTYSGSQCNSQLECRSGSQCNNTVSEHQRRLIVSSLIIHDYGHMAFSHEIERFIRTHVDNSYTHEHEVFRNVYNQIDDRYKHLVESDQVDLDRLSYLMLDSYFAFGEPRFTFDDIIRSYDYKTCEFTSEFTKEVLEFRSFMKNTYYQSGIHRRSQEILEDNKDIIIDILVKNYKTLPLVNGKFFNDVELMKYVNETNVIV
jgi:hypothetical protein